MRFDTAVQRLRKIAVECDRVSSFYVGLVAAYVYGDLLSGAGVEVVQVAFVVDRPPEELPWLAEPADLRALAGSMRLDRAPVRWVWRPAGEPVGNHEVVGAVRFWSREKGAEDRVLDALSVRRFDELVREPSAQAQTLDRDQDRALAHLREVADRYWDLQWRREHKGDGVYPEEHLWRAVRGYLELLGARSGSPQT